MNALLQSTIGPAAINLIGATLAIGGLAVTLLWLRVFYRSSGI